MPTRWPLRAVLVARGPSPAYLRYWRRRYLRIVARAKREAQSDAAIARLPQPRVATPEEVRAFFAAHGSDADVSAP